MAKFYDTNYILEHIEDVLQDEKFYISSITLLELEHIKVSRTKDENTKYKARRAIRLLNNHSDKYEVVIYKEHMSAPINFYGIEVTPDSQICQCAASLIETGIDITFCSDDISCATIAREIFGLNTTRYINNKNEYLGYKQIQLSEQEIAYFYEHKEENVYNLLINEYLILQDINGNIIGRMVWNGEEHLPVSVTSIRSDIFGQVKAYDAYQLCALHSFQNNILTMIKGAAGTGKSYLALGYLLSALSKHKIDKIIILTNTCPTINSARLGFYPGTRSEKLMESNIGIMLSAKLGDSFIVEKLINENKLVLLPMCDIRGFDTSGMNCGVYITEAQNMDISLMKLALQRVGEGCKCIIDGDYNAQVDDMQYAGANNGMRRLSEVFRGQDFYGEVELQTIYRSRIAAIADTM